MDKEEAIKKKLQKEVNKKLRNPNKDFKSMSIDELEEELKLWGWDDEDETDIRDKIIRRINKKKRQEYKQKLDEIVTSKKEDIPIKKEVSIKEIKKEVPVKIET